MEELLYIRKESVTASKKRKMKTDKSNKKKINN